MKYTLNSQYIDNKKDKRFKKIAFVFAILILIGVSYFAGLYSAGKKELIKEFAKSEAVYLGKVLGKYGGINEIVLAKDVDFSLFWSVWNTLKEDYVDKGELNEKEMFYGAIAGMTSALGDPYTIFLDPKMTQEFEDDLAGTFEGIGAEIGIRDNILTIIAPLEDMPAQEAGLKAGDKVYAIDGEPTMGLGIDEAVRKIRGPKGTEVTLTIMQKGAEVGQDIKIKRGLITVKSVKTKLRADDIFVIKVTNFNDDTSKLFNNAVSEILVKNPKGVILDLRNNPGGFLETSIELSSEWIEEGPVVIEQFSDDSKKEYSARGRARLKEYQTVVLVNQGSASASEIVAGALRDYEKAVIVGEQTFGKGSVQTLREFSDGSSVKITVAKWLTPNGDSINDKGISPDEEVELTIEDWKEDQDPQMDRAVEILSKKEVN